MLVGLRMTQPLHPLPPQAVLPRPGPAHPGLPKPCTLLGSAWPGFPRPCSLGGSVSRVLPGAWAPTLPHQPVPLAPTDRAPSPSWEQAPRREQAGGWRCALLQAEQHLPSGAESAAWECGGHWGGQWLVSVK